MTLIPGVTGSRFSYEHKTSMKLALRRCCGLLVVGALAVIVVEDVGLVFRVVMGAVAAPQQRAEKGEHED